MSKLKQCPFCSDTTITEKHGKATCWSCMITMSTEDWNTRPPMQDCAEEMYHTLDSILCTIKLGEVQNGNGQLGRYKNSIEQLLAKARGEL